MDIIKKLWKLVDVQGSITQLVERNEVAGNQEFIRLMEERRRLIDEIARAYYERAS